MLAKPQIVAAHEQLTAVIHITVPREKIQEVMGPAIGEVIAAIAAQGMAPAGPCYSFHWRRPTEVFDFEVGFPVSGPLEPAGRVRMSSLPATQVVRTIYSGGYEGLGAAWGEFCAWIDEQGLKVGEALWECYLSGPESSSDPSQWRTQLNRPMGS